MLKIGCTLPWRYIFSGGTCGKIVNEVASEFGHSENVIGWQIDNEMILSQPVGTNMSGPFVLKLENPAGR